MKLHNFEFSHISKVLIHTFFYFKMRKRYVSKLEKYTFDTKVFFHFRHQNPIGIMHAVMFQEGRCKTSQNSWSYKEKTFTTFPEKGMSKTFENEKKVCIQTWKIHNWYKNLFSLSTIKSRWYHADTCIPRSNMQNKW